MNCYPFQNPPLPYAYDALEPMIDTQTMILHHDRHLQTYVDNLNKALEGYPSLQNRSLEILLCMADRLPQQIRRAVHDNAGGVYNHELYFAQMSPTPKQVPEGALLAAVQSAFGSFEDFQAKMKAAGLAVFGSGYVFLVCDGRGRLKLFPAPNQDTPLPLGLYPLLALDVWEHAYYLKHYNKRADYINDWLSLIDWAWVEQRYGC